MTLLSLLSKMFLSFSASQYFTFSILYNVLCTYLSLHAHCHCNVCIAAGVANKLLHRLWKVLSIPMIVKVTPFVGVRMLGRRGIVSVKCVSDVVNDCVQIVHRLAANACKQRPPGVDSLSAGWIAQNIANEFPRDFGNGRASRQRTIDWRWGWSVSGFPNWKQEGMETQHVNFP